MTKELQNDSRFQARFQNLMQAIYFNDHESVKNCFDEYPELRYSYTAKTNQSLIDILCRFGGDIEMAKIIINKTDEAPSEDFYLDQDGNTPLNSAIAYKRYDLAEFFLRFYDPNFPNHSGKTAFDFAKDNQLMTDFLINRLPVYKISKVDKKSDVSDIKRKEVVSVDESNNSSQNFKNFSDIPNLTNPEAINSKTYEPTTVAEEFMQDLLKDKPRIISSKTELKLMNAEDKLSREVEDNYFLLATVDANEAEKKEVLLSINKLINELTFGINPQLQDSVIADIDNPNIEKSCQTLLGQLMISNIKEKRYSAVEKILNHEEARKCLGNIEFLDSEQSTPLILACKIGAFDIAKLLLERGAKVKVFDQQKRSPLHYCALQEGEKSYEVARIILDKIGNNKEFLDIKDESGLSIPFCCCAKNGNPLILEQILKVRPSIYDPLEQSNLFALAFHHDNTGVKNLFMRKELDFKPSVEFIKGLQKVRNERNKKNTPNEVVSIVSAQKTAASPSNQGEKESLTP